MKTCRVCKAKFTPRLQMQIACSLECALSLAVSKRAKEEKRALVLERKADKVKKEALKTKRDWIADAQKTFNLWVRMRDAGKPCICCGRQSNGEVYGGDFDAGHYRSRGSAPHLRFDERNVHAQLKQCNRFDAGNAVGYRMGLIARIGLEAVEALESDNAPKHYSIEDLKTLKAVYQVRINQMRRERA